MNLFGGYKASKLKPQLKMAVTRFQIAANKKSALSKQQIREIATLLAEKPNPKEEKARIKAESLIRDDNTVEAYEILQLTCDLLAERINLITHSRECPPDLVSSVSTLIWASTMVDIPELIEVRKQFRCKYGKQFDEDAIMNVGGVINERVAAKLSVQPPSAYLVQTYLEKIADEHQVKWTPKVPLTAESMADPTAAPIGYSVPVGGGSGLNTTSNLPTFNGGNNNMNINSNHPSAPPLSPSFVIPPAPSKSSDGKQQSANASLKDSSVTGPDDDGDDNEEIDIYVPGVPRNPPGNNGQTSHNNGDDSDNDDFENDGGSGGQINRNNGGESGEESYDYLAARFAMLQR
mmetsp:Transcript_1543/g.2891  ORF Transcript_1543/g.2891 Transcript_1543/m.2891 type:complete len:348 (+) Transcript_1543:292-1335(+)